MRVKSDKSCLDHLKKFMKAKFEEDFEFTVKTIMTVKIDVMSNYYYSDVDKMSGIQDWLANYYYDPNNPEGTPKRNKKNLQRNTTRL